MKALWLTAILAMAPLGIQASEQSADSARATQAKSAPSLILNDGTHWTSIPARAAIHAPAALRGKIGAKPVGILLPWKDFLKKNPEWITTCEVSFDVAAGYASLPIRKVEELTKPDQLVVAIHNGRPSPVRIENPNAALTQR